MVHPEAVVCVIEVKTKLTKQSFCESITALQSVKKVSGKKHSPTFLFAYDSQAFSPTTLSSWYSAVTVPDELGNYPWCLFALNRGIINLKLEKDCGVYAHIPIEGDVRQGPRLKSLSLFLQAIRKAALLYSESQINPFEYAFLDGLRYGAAGYRFGGQSVISYRQTP